MPIERGFETFLIKHMSQDPDAPTEGEEAIEVSGFKKSLLNFFGKMWQQSIDESDTDGAIDIEDEIGLFARGDAFHFQRKVCEREFFEVFTCV